MLCFIKQSLKNFDLLRFIVPKSTIRLGLVDINFLGELLAKITKLKGCVSLTAESCGINYKSAVDFKIPTFTLVGLSPSQYHQRVESI